MRLGYIGDRRAPRKDWKEMIKINLIKSLVFLAITDYLISSCVCVLCVYVSVCVYVCVSICKCVSLGVVSFIYKKLPQCTELAK